MSSSRKLKFVRRKHFHSIEQPLISLDLKYFTIQIKLGYLKSILQSRSSLLPSYCKINDKKSWLKKCHSYDASVELAINNTEEMGGRVFLMCWRLTCDEVNKRLNPFRNKMANGKNPLCLKAMAKMRLLIVLLRLSWWPLPLASMQMLQASLGFSWRG